SPPGAEAGVVAVGGDDLEPAPQSGGATASGVPLVARAPLGAGGSLRARGPLRSRLAGGSALAGRSLGALQPDVQLDRIAHQLLFAFALVLADEETALLGPAEDGRSMRRARSSEPERHARRQRSDHDPATVDHAVLLKVMRTQQLAWLEHSNHTTLASGRSSNSASWPQASFADRGRACPASLDRPFSGTRPARRGRDVSAPRRPARFARARAAASHGRRRTHSRRAGRVGIPRSSRSL